MGDFAVMRFYSSSMNKNFQTIDFMLSTILDLQTFLCLGIKTTRRIFKFKYTVVPFPLFTGN